MNNAKENVTRVSATLLTN